MARRIPKPHRNNYKSGFSTEDEDEDQFKFADDSGDEEEGEWIGEEEGEEEEGEEEEGEEEEGEEGEEGREEEDDEEDEEGEEDEEDEEDEEEEDEEEEDEEEEDEEEENDEEEEKAHLKKMLKLYERFKKQYKSLSSDEKSKLFKNLSHMRFGTTIKVGNEDVIYNQRVRNHLFTRMNEINNPKAKLDMGTREFNAFRSLFSKMTPEHKKVVTKEYKQRPIGDQFMFQQKPYIYTRELKKKILEMMKILSVAPEGLRRSTRHKQINPRLFTPIPGTQKTPFMNPQAYRETMKNIHQKNFYDEDDEDDDDKMPNDEDISSFKTTDELIDSLLDNAFGGIIKNKGHKTDEDANILNARLLCKSILDKAKGDRSKALRELLRKIHPDKQQDAEKKKKAENLTKEFMYQCPKEDILTWSKKGKGAWPWEKER